MPQIPDTFAPSTLLSPDPQTALTAGGVDAMRNAAPQQQEQMGEAVSKAGSTLDSIGERIQWQLDDARTKSAVTNFMQQAQQVVHGDGTADNPGYLNTRGQAAINGFGDATSALAKIKQQGLDGLDNNFQKMMYNRVTTAHLTNFGTVMADHHFQQNALYSAQASSDSANSYAQSAISNPDSIGATDVNGDKTGNFYTFSNQAIQQKQHALFIATGASPDSPQGVEAAKEVTTGIAQGVISKMLDNHNYQGAQSFYESELAQGHIDQRTAEMLGSAIKRNTDVETVKDVSNQLISNALRTANGQPTGINPQLPIKGGSYTMNKNEDGSQTFTVPANTAVNAAADGKVSSVTQDKPGDPYTVEIAHSDGSTTQYGNLSAVNYKVGDSVMQGQQPIGLTAKGGLDYSMAGKDGKAVDPTTQVLPKVDLTKFADPTMAKTVIDQINNSSYDPQMKAQMATYVDSQQKVNFRQDAENKQLTVQPLQDAFMQHGINSAGPNGAPRYSNDALTPSQWATMEQNDPEKAAQLMAIPAAQARQRMSQAREDASYAAQVQMLSPEHLQALVDLATHPDAFPAYVIARGKDLTAPEFTAAYGKSTGKQTEQVSIPKDLMDQAFTAAGYQRLINTDGQSVTTKMVNQKLFLPLHNQIQLNLTALKNAKGQQLTPAEMTKGINDVLIGNTIMVPQPSGIFWKNSAKAVNLPDATASNMDQGYEPVQTPDGKTVNVPVGHITPEDAASVTEGLARAGISATQSHIASAWLQTQNGQNWRKFSKQ